MLLTHPHPRRQPLLKPQDIAVLTGWPDTGSSAPIDVNPTRTRRPRRSGSSWHRTRPDESTAAAAGMRCSVHDWSERWVRDLPILDARTVPAGAPVCRVRCPGCGVRTERIDWLPPYARLTLRLAESAARLCQVLPVKHVAEHFALAWDQVKPPTRPTSTASSTRWTSPGWTR